jgi:hypothetical protein
MTPTPLTAPELQGLISKWFEYEKLELIPFFDESAGASAFLLQHFTFTPTNDEFGLGYLPADLTGVAQVAWRLTELIEKILEERQASREALMEASYFAAHLVRHLEVTPHSTVAPVPLVEVAVARTLAEDFPGWVPDPTEPAHPGWAEAMVAAATLSLRKVNLTCLLSAHRSAALLHKTFTISVRERSAYGLEQARRALYDATAKAEAQDALPLLPATINHAEELLTFFASEDALPLHINRCAGADTILFSWSADSYAAEAEITGAGADLMLRRKGGFSTFHSHSRSAAAPAQDDPQFTIRTGAILRLFIQALRKEQEAALQLLEHS